MTTRPTDEEMSSKKLEALTKFLREVPSTSVFTNTHVSITVSVAAEIVLSLESFIAERQDLEGYRRAVAGVLSRYQDGRIFTNPHTKQVARSIAEEIELTAAPDGDTK